MIDYFADMTLLREGDSINFQKASCTLDGCIKIYTSRIDSVDNETKKLLLGLFEKQEETVEEDENGVVVKHVKRRRITHTIESDEEALNVKSFDLEFVADPLFKKTAADFDEGGAKGLLLNHLCISSTGKVIFDAYDDAQPVDAFEDVLLPDNPLQG